MKDTRKRLKEREIDKQTNKIYPIVEAKREGTSHCDIEEMRSGRQPKHLISKIGPLRPKWKVLYLGSSKTIQYNLLSSVKKKLIYRKKKKFSITSFVCD